MSAVASLRERAPRYRQRPGLRESELARLWQMQRLPPEALVTTAGDEVFVAYRGRRGGGPGPDFRDAVVGIAGGALIKGDVELHVRSADFQRHGHHLDRAYLRLVLHVVFEADGGPTALLDARVVPTVALGRWVQRRAGELRAALADPVEYREPCHSAVSRLGTPAAVGVLHDLAAARLRERAARLLPLVERLGPEQALYQALARALGLTRNCDPMEAVARALPLTELRSLAEPAAEPALTVEAALLGTAGLLEGQLVLWTGASAQREQRLLAAWQALGGSPLPAAWAAGPYRPGCGPRERLAGLAALVCRDGPPLDATLADWRSLLGLGAAALLEALQATKVIGRDRAIELAVNAVLPWLLAAYAGDAAIEAGVERSFRELPGPPAYGATRLLARALLGAEGTSLVRGAAATQGALQMTRDWCTQGGCGHCPLS